MVGEGHGNLGAKLASEEHAAGAGQSPCSQWEKWRGRHSHGGHAPQGRALARFHHRIETIGSVNAHLDSIRVGRNPPVRPLLVRTTSAGLRIVEPPRRLSCCSRSSNQRFTRPIPVDLMASRINSERPRPAMFKNSTDVQVSAVGFSVTVESPITLSRNAGLSSLDCGDRMS